MPKGLVVVFGGSGFIGRYAARTLVEQGYRVRVACRRVGEAADVRLAGAPGWVDIVQANVRNEASIRRAMEGADAVVNLVGILFETGKQTYESAQRDGAANVAEIAAEMGIKRFVHMSAIGADPEGQAAYARTKGRAEELVRESIPEAVILRPSVVFGPEDDFLNRFAEMVKSLPPFAPMPAIGGGGTKVQPVYAGDVADAIANAVSRDDVAGKTFELGGPRAYTFNEIYDFIFKTTARKTWKMPLPFFMARLLGLSIGALWRYVPPFRWHFFGPPPITGDQVQLLRKDNVVAEDALTLADIGITQLESVEALAPTYLWRFRPYGEFHIAEET